MALRGLVVQVAAAAHLLEVSVVEGHFLTLHIEMTFLERGLFLPYEIQRYFGFLFWPKIYFLRFYSKTYIKSSLTC
jgi:hypothetical protein